MRRRIDEADRVEQQLALELQLVEKNHQNEERRRQIEQLRNRVPEPTPRDAAPRSSREEQSVERDVPIYQAAPLPAPIYRGDSQQELANFRFDCDGCFREQPERFNTEPKKVFFGESGLRGKIKNRWVAHLHQRKMQDGNFDRSQIRWEDFIAFLSAGRGDEQSRTLTASAQLKLMHQGENEKVIDYVDRFEACENDMNEQIPPMMRISLFVNGLCDPLRIPIASSAQTPDTFDAAVAWARRIESNLTTVQHSPSAPTRDNYRPRRDSPPRGSRRDEKGGAPTPHAPPMTAPAAAGFSPRKGGGCYRCGKPGHYASNCPEPPSDSWQNSVRCYTCDQRGHTSPYCPKSRCARCGEFGHTASRCQAPAPRDNAAITQPNNPPAETRRA